MMQSNFQTRYESSQILTGDNQAKRIQGFDHRSLQKKVHSQYLANTFLMPFLHQPIHPPIHPGTPYEYYVNRCFFCKVGVVSKCKEATL